MRDKVIKHLIEACTNECKKQKTLIQIEEWIIDPVIYKVVDKIKPYIIGATVFFTFMLVLILSIVVLVVIQLLSK